MFQNDCLREAHVHAHVLFGATQNHLFWGSAIKPDLIISWWWVLWSGSASLSLWARLMFVIMERGGGGGGPALPSVSQCPLFVLWRRDMLPQGDEEEGGTVAVKSRLWLMSRGAMPSHWAEFTSSHNHLCLHPPSTSFSLLVSDLLLFFCPRPICLHFRKFLPVSSLFSASPLCHDRVCLSHNPPVSSLPSFFSVPWIFPLLQPLEQEQEPRALEPARPDLPVQGDSSPSHSHGRLLAQTNQDC